MTCSLSESQTWKTHSKKVRSGRMISLRLSRVVPFFLPQAGMCSPRVTQRQWWPMFITDLLSPCQLRGHPEDEKPQWQPHTSLLDLFSSSCSASPGNPFMLTPMLFGVSNISPIKTEPQWEHTLDTTSCPHLTKNLPGLCHYYPR